MWKRGWWPLWVMVIAAGCGETAEEPPSAIERGPTGGKADEFDGCGEACNGPAPLGPEADDPMFAVSPMQQWLLIGDGLVDDQGALDVEVTVPPEVGEVVAWVGDRGTLLDADGPRRFGSVDVSRLSPGDYELVLAEAGAEVGFARHTFTRTHALYVSVSIDWDGPDPPDINLERQERLHERHPELVMSHLVGPYTFTAGLEREREAAITDWLRRMRDDHGDEIGLHIHPYCHFVETADVDCRLEPEFSAVGADRAGYTVFLTSYTETEMRRLLRRAKELFAENGLGVPTSFRAGAWAAQPHTLRALDAEGFTAEGSAVNWALLEEWEGNGPLFDFLRENWAPFDELSQPFHPAHDDHHASGVDNLRLLEIPDNGALVDYVRTDEMNDVLRANLGELDRPRVVSIGYHVDNFSESFFERMDGTLDFVDERLDATDGGPIVYVRMDELPRIAWNDFAR